MEEETSFYNPSNEKLIGFFHVPTEQTDKGIVLAHCFTCSRHQRIMRKMCDTLAESGVLVLRFDFSGNGDSEGTFGEATYSKELGDLSAGITFLRSKGVKKVGVLGHSMGSAVSILHAQRDERVMSLCVLSGQSDTASIKNIFDKGTIDKAYADGEADVELFGKTWTMSKEFFEDAERHDLKTAIESLNKPVCIIHGGKDETIDVQNAHRLYACAKDPKALHIIAGADHMFSQDKHLAEAEKIVVDWFKETLI